MTDSSTNSSEMLQTAANGGDIAANGAVSVDQQLLDTYCWGDAGWKADPLKQEYFRLSANIAKDLGIKGSLKPNIGTALVQLGAVRSVGDNGKPSGRKQTNPDNPTGNTARGQGFFVPPRVAVSNGQAVCLEEQATEAEPTVTAEPEAASKPKRKPKSKRNGIKLKDMLGNTPSESRVDPNAELGEDGQPLEHETGAFVGKPEAVTFALDFGGGDTGAVLSGQAFVLEEQATEAEPEVATPPVDSGDTADEAEPEVDETAEATTAPPETPKAEAFPEFGSMDKSRVMGSVVRLGEAARPAYLPALPVSGEVVQRVRNLGCSSTLIEAVSYAALGWKSFPLVANGKTPAVKSGFKEASADVGQLLAWFDDGEFRGRGSHSTANIGIATGETTAGYDLVVLDIDQKNGKDGSRVVSGAEGELGKLPETLVAQTPSGGLHYLFRAPKRSGIGCGVNVFKAKGEGLDIRADGGYIAASPSVVDGKQYLWKGDKGVAWLPDSWVKALQAECPVGGKRDAVSGSSTFDGKTKTRGELLPMPEDVAAAIAEHAVPSSVGRADGWLKVLSVLSAFEGGEALARHWSSTGAYADRFDAGSFEAGWDEVHSGWNDGVPMDKGTLFNLVKQHSPDWKTPEQRKRDAEAAQLKAEQREADGFGALPAYLQPLLDMPRGGVPDPVAAVTDDKAVEVLHAFIAKGNAVWARVSAGLDVGHDAEYLFIAGMLTMNAEAVKYQVEHNPVPKGRSSKYMTKDGKLRAVIMHSDGSKPETADAVDMDLFTPDYVGGTADAVIRLANRIMLERDATLGAKPTGDECVLVRRVFELSPLGQYWRDNATEISKRRNGWSLDSAVKIGLGKAKRYSTNTPQPSGKRSGGGLTTGELPKTGGRLSWIDKELTHQGGAVGELLDTPTSDQIESLLGVYGCRAVFDEMRCKVVVHGFPKRFTKLDDTVTAIRELASRHETEWRKGDVTDFLKLLANGTGYHPALEWVQRIPWDGVDRFGDLLATVEPEDGYSDMWRIGLHRWCMGAVRCLVQPEGMRGVPTIVFYAPAGGEGKDRWQSSLCPLEYQARPNGFDPTNLNWMLTALNGWLGIFPEITTQSRKADIENIKAFLTADKDSYTSKYEMDVNDRLRRTVYLASTNDSDYLADRTGTNRRFITIAVKSVNHRHSIDTQQFWAQMLHTFEAAWAVSDEGVHRYWLEGDESRLLAEVNETHTIADLLEDQIKALWDFDDEAWQRDKRRTDWAVSVQAVVRRLDPDSAMNTSNVPQMFMKRIAREMSRLGVIKKQMRGKDGKTNYYLLPPNKRMK